MTVLITKWWRGITWAAIILYCFNADEEQVQEEEELPPDDLVQKIMMGWRTREDAGNVSFIN